MLTLQSRVDLELKHLQMDSLHCRRRVPSELSIQSASFASNASLSQTHGRALQQPLELGEHQQPGSSPVIAPPCLDISREVLSISNNNTDYRSMRVYGKDLYCPLRGKQRLQSVLTMYSMLCGLYSTPRATLIAMAIL
jgi:hypothetical protein